MDKRVRGRTPDEMIAEIHDRVRRMETRMVHFGKGLGLHLDGDGVQMEHGALPGHYIAQVSGRDVSISAVISATQRYIKEGRPNAAVTEVRLGDELIAVVNVPAWQECKSQ